MEVIHGFITSYLGLLCKRKYCKTLNKEVSKILQFNENDILGQINFGILDIPWIQIIQKILCKSVTVFLTFLFIPKHCGIY